MMENILSLKKMEGIIKSTQLLVKRLEDNGAGEIFLTSANKEFKGFDIFIQKVSETLEFL